MSRICNGKLPKKQARHNPNRIRKHFIVSGGIITGQPRDNQKVELPKCPLCQKNLIIGGDNVTVVLFNGIQTNVHKECPNV